MEREALSGVRRDQDGPRSAERSALAGKGEQGAARSRAFPTAAQLRSTAAEDSIRKAGPVCIISHCGA